MRSARAGGELLHAIFAAHVADCSPKDAQSGTPEKSAVLKQWPNHSLWYDHSALRMLALAAEKAKPLAASSFMYDEVLLIPII